MMTLAALERPYALAAAAAAARPGLFAAVFAALCVLFSAVSQNGVSLDGDGPYYLLAQQALLQHGGFAISDDLLGLLSERTELVGRFRPEFFAEGLDGRQYTLHFWAYSALSAPVAALLGLVGLDPVLAFFFLNLAFAVAAAAYIARSHALTPSARVLVLFSFGATTLNWYGAWPHPEVMTAALVLIAAIAFVERHWLFCAIGAGVAALQNPSVALILLVAALAIFVDFLMRRLDMQALIAAAWRIGLGGAIAAAAPLWSLFTFGVLNPIVAAGFVDPARVDLEMMAHYLFDQSQGGLIGAPFIFAGLAVVIWRRFSAWRAERAEPLVKHADWLLVMSLAISAPVLAQINFNSGQYFVLRYVAWSFAPALIWLGLEFGRAPRPVGIAWGAGLAIYAASFLAFLGAKFAYVVEARRDPELPVYCDWCRFKPWTFVVLDHAPGLYNPLSEVFGERVSNIEINARAETHLPIAYIRADGVITKILIAEADLNTARVVNEVCGGRALEGKAVRVTHIRDGLAYINGRMRCAP